MHEIDRFFRMERSWNSIQVFLNRFPSSEIEIGIDGNQSIGLVRGSDIRRILLRGPRGFPIIHLLIVFRPKRGRRDKRVSDEFVSVFESITLLIEVEDFFRCFPKEKGISQVPVSGDEKNLLNRGRFQHPFKERGKKPVDEGFLVWDHVFVSLCRGEGGKKVTPDRHDFR